MWIFIITHSKCVSTPLYNEIFNMDIRHGVSNFPFYVKTKPIFFFHHLTLNIKISIRDSIESIKSNPLPKKMRIRWFIVSMIMYLNTLSIQKNIVIQGAYTTIGIFLSWVYTKGGIRSLLYGDRMVFSENHEGIWKG